MKKEQYKVLYLINGLGPGGAEMMLYRLLERLDRATFRPVVVTLLNISGPLKQKIEALGIEVHSAGIKNKSDLGGILRLYNLIKKVDPDILHTQLFAADILGRIMGRMLKIPVIITSIRNIYYGGVFRNLLIKWTERFTDRTTYVSRAAAERFKALGVVPAEKQQVVYNGLDPDFFYSGLGREEKLAKRKELGLPAEGFLFLAVGSLTGQKGYYDLLAALAQVKKTDPNFYLTIAGRGPLAEALKKDADQKGLQEKVFFLGRSDDVPLLMAVSDTLVLSSHWEGMPGVVMEAMASELPVIATSVGGTPELVEDGVSGYLVPAGEVESIRAALEKMIMLAERDRITMGKAGRKRVEEYFHVDKMVKGYEKVYDECLREKNLR